MKWLSVVCLCVVLVAGCQQNPSERLNSPPQGQTAWRSPMQQPFNSMTHNATLQDMSIADIHFAGTSAHLNGTGEVRMQRLAEILKTYGGEVRYNSQVQDERLVQSRLQRIEDYLASAGVDMDRVTVRTGIPASVGMTAAEAIQAQQAPTAETGGAAAGGLMPPLSGMGGANK